MKKIFQNKKLHTIFYSLFLIVVGVFLTLSFEIIRFTKYVEPKTVEMDPKTVYATILNDPGKSLFLDVRTLGEYTNLHASSSISFPIQKLYDAWRTLPRDDKKIYLICSSGRLAAVAYGYLQLHGFRNIVHVTGGIQNWVDEGVPAISKPVFVDKNFSLDKPIESSSPVGQ